MTFEIKVTDPVNVWYKSAANNRKRACVICEWGNGGDKTITVCSSGGTAQHNKSGYSLCHPSPSAILITITALLDLLLYFWL